MSYVDIAIIVIVSLCALIGLAKGLFKSLVSFFGWMISIIAAFFLTKTVAYALLDVEAISGFVLGTGEGFSLYNLTLGFLPALSEAPEFLQGLIAPLMGSITELTASYAVSAEQGIAMLLSYYIFSAIVFVGLLIAIKIVMILFTMFANSFDKGERPGGISRLLGFVVGAAKGVVYVGAIFLVMVYVTAFPQLAPLSEEIDKSVVGKPIYSTVQMISDKFVTMSDEDTMTKLVSMMDFEAIEEGEEEEEIPGGEDIDNGNEDDEDIIDNGDEDDEDAIDNGDEDDDGEDEDDEE